MSNRIRTLLAASILALTAPAVSLAQSSSRPAQTDRRWYPWLGCWQSDSAVGDQHTVSPATTCIVPVAGSPAVEALTILRGKIILRNRLDASGKPQPLSGQGCDGFETVNWSSSGRRVYLRSDYTCGATKGTSTAIYALNSSGEWLNANEVRSGSGAIVSVDRRREVDVPAEVPADVAHALARQQLAVSTARAAAAAPITADEIIEAVRRVNGAVVRSWLVASEERFNFDQQQLLALAHADIPPSVMQTVMSPQNADRQVLGMANGQSTVFQSNPPYGGAQQVYSAPVESQPMTTMYVCPPSGCAGPNPYSMYNGYSGYNGYGYPPYYGAAYPIVYSVPLIVRRGGSFREPERPRQPVHPPVVRGPVGRRP